MRDTKYIVVEYIGSTVHMFGLRQRTRKKLTIGMIEVQ